MSVEIVGIEIIAEMDREFHDSPDRVIAILGGAYLDSCWTNSSVQSWLTHPRR